MFTYGMPCLHFKFTFITRAIFGQETYGMNLMFTLKTIYQFKLSFVTFSFIFINFEIYPLEKAITLIIVILTQIFKSLSIAIYDYAHDVSLHQNAKYWQL